MANVEIIPKNINTEINKLKNPDLLSIKYWPDNALSANVIEREFKKPITIPIIKSVSIIIVIFQPNNFN